MPIRWRLTLWFSLLLTLILILSGALIHTLMERYLRQEVDDDLKVYSARVHGTLHPEEIPSPLDYEVIHSSLPPINEFAAPGLYIQIITREGAVVVRSDNLGDQELPADPGLIERGFKGEAMATVSAADGIPLRIMASPLFLRDETLLLEVARSLEHVDDTLAQVRWALFGGVLVALALAILSGAVLVRRALQPVKNITRTAESIETSGNLSQRVGYSGPMDEIGELATTFDHMIEHLDRVFRSQRDFVADASHDLRSPLTVLRGNLDLLKRASNEEERRASLDAMEREVKRMIAIVNDLLLLAEVESGGEERVEPVSLKLLVLDAADRARSLVPTHTIATEGIEDIVILGNPDRLRRLLDNLVDNAIKYTPEDRTITLSTFHEGGWACLRVRDSGIGIPPEHLPRIFDRFYRVDRARSRSRGGTGLGLAIVKAIAERYGGTVSVCSELGRGTTFTVRFKG